MLVSVALLAALPARAADPVPFDAVEAEAALAILDAEAAGRAATPAEWQRLHDSAGYRALHRREAAMQRPFSDDELTRFLAAPATVARRALLAATLRQWQERGLAHALALAHAYLPPSTPSCARSSTARSPTPTRRPGSRRPSGARRAPGTPSAGRSRP